MTIFELARKSRTDLLAIWHRMHPDGHDMNGRAGRVSGLTGDQLAAAIWEARRPKT